MLVAFSLFFLIIHIGRGCVHGDEYSHWMAVVKGMFYNNKLGNVKDAYTAYKDYPPASALLEYFVLKVGNRFLESDVFRIWGIFQITLLLPFCEALRKNGQRIGYSMIVTFLLPTIFYYSYTETLVDGLLGMLMAYVIYNYYCFKNDWFKYISLALALFVLSITKASGVALAVISLVIIGVDIVIRFDKKDKYSILGCIGGMIAVLFGKFSWQYLLHSENTNSVWRVNRITAASIVEMLKEGKTNLSVPINAVLKDFIKDYVYPNDALNLISVSYLVWIVVAVILGVLIIGCKKFEMKRIVGLVITILLGLIIYSISILICYLFLWGDSLKDGSFYRYMNTYFSAMLISLFCIYMINKKKSSQRLEILIITVLLLLGRTYEVMKMTVLFPVVNYASVKEEKKLKPLNPIVMSTDDQVLIIVDRDIANEKNKLSYEMIPAHASFLSEDSVYLKQLVDKISENECRYLWIKTREKIEENRVILEQNTLYQIIKDGTNYRYVKCEVRK